MIKKYLLAMVFTLLYLFVTQKIIVIPEMDLLFGAVGMLCVLTIMGMIKP